MNANHQSQSGMPLGMVDREQQVQRLSACMDGDVPVQEIDQLLSADMGAYEDLSLTWASYHLIGESLRGEHPAVGGARPSAFLEAFRTRMASESAQVAAQPLSVVVPASVSHPVRPAEAANDPVFRWKMVAGFASLAAVVAVAWSSLGALQQGPASGAVQLVNAPANNGAVIAVREAQPLPASTVAVQTPQGTIIRDERLQQLLAEHRQNGMSALQMPAGFLRNATHDGARSR